MIDIKKFYFYIYLMTFNHSIALKIQNLKVRKHLHRVIMLKMSKCIISFIIISVKIFSNYYE